MADGEAESEYDGQASAEEQQRLVVGDGDFVVRGYVFL
jgi:hypothetical protein